MKCPSCQSDVAPDARFCGECGKALPAPTVKAPTVKASTVTAAAEPAIDFSTLHTVDGGETRNPRDVAAKLLEPGAVFATRYEIVRLIGEGGMGVVYRAHDRLTEKDVALKLIRADRLAGKDAVKRLVREGVTSRDIRHPNVVAVYDVGETDAQPYMSMEFLEGRSLRSWNRERMQANTEWSMKTASAVIREILLGLDAAHKAGVVHRDLKPENVMMLSEPTDGGVRLKLLDFGIARAGGGADTGATSLGTRGYMAPEQITAPDAAQPSADLYSLSVMFYELLVGVVPQGHWQPPSHGRGDVPSGIDDLVQKGLSNNPRSRPQTVADYLKALDGAIAGRPKPPPGPPPVNVELDRILEIFKPKKPAADDPHEQPAGQKSHWGWFMHCMRRYADGKGRAHRKEYWGFTLYALVFILVAIGFDSSVSAEYVGYGAFVPMTSLVVILLLIPPSLAVTSRRLHDLGRSGGSWLAAGNKVGFERGTVGDNPYGPDPLTGMEKAAP